MRYETFIGSAVFLWIMTGLVATSAWITHIITCIQDDRMLFLIAGAIAAPVAVVHGVGIWLGAW